MQISLKSIAGKRIGRVVSFWLDRPIWRIIVVALLTVVCSCFGATAQPTEKVYLSGTGKDHTIRWQFYCTEGRKSGKWTTIPVPSCWEMQGFGHYNYGNDHRKAGVRIGREVGRYKYTFTVPAAWKGQSINIVFEGSMTDTKVEVNGKLAGPIHQGAFYSFRYDISDILRYGSENLLAVEVSKVSSNQSINEAERQADYWIFGGIFRPVYLEIKPREHIKRVAINAGADGQFTSAVFTEGLGNAATLSCQIETLSGEKVGNVIKSHLDPQAAFQTLSASFDAVKTWSPEFPNLYRAVFYLTDKQGRMIHKTTQRFGFRTVAFRKGDGFYVNGRKIRFKGVCYHSFWPSSGRTLSKALVIRDVNLMKDMNMNAVRLSHYPRAQYFYEVCDSLGLFVADELAGWQAAYDTRVGRRLVTEMVTADVNHPSIIMWNNGNEGGYNFDLDPYFGRLDPQKRPVNHPGSMFEGIDSHHYPSFHGLVEKLHRGNKVFFPDEFVHALYAGGGGAGLQDYWNLMQQSPRSAGGFIWDFSDGCVVRTDKQDSLDCAGNQDADGILGPYREKSGSYYAVKKIWSPVEIQELPIAKNWNKKLQVKNSFFFTNLSRVQFNWALVNYPGPFEQKKKVKQIDSGYIESPDVAPQCGGYLHLLLPEDWDHADALRIVAHDPHGRQIYAWTFPIKKPDYRRRKIIPDSAKDGLQIRPTEQAYILTSGSLKVTIDKQSGYIQQIQKDGERYSLNGGPVLQGDSAVLKQLQIAADSQQITAVFSNNYKVSYSLKDEWLKLSYSCRPKGNYAYFGIGFRYPGHKVKEMRWLGRGPNRVWKNRLAGAEYGLWHRQQQVDSGTVDSNGYRWQLPKFKGYYAGLNWAVLGTEEGPITVVTAKSDIFLGLLSPEFGPDPKHAKAAYPETDISFLQAISPVGTKFKEASAMGPSSQSNLFDYGFQVDGHPFKYTNTLWFYFGSKK